MTMKDFGLKTCQRCDDDYRNRNTKSRRDHNFSICPTCCDEEAMIDWFKNKGRESEIPGEVMERETKFGNKIVRGELKN